MNPRRAYWTDVPDREWQRLEPLVPAPKPGGRPAKYARREIVTAIFSVLRAGCSWRLWPHDFPPWRIVFYYFWPWRTAGIWEKIHDALRGDLRQAVGKQRQPSAGIIESQSVKTTEKGGSAGTMRASWSRAASATCESIPWGWCWPWWCTPPTSKIRPAQR
jgi:transposase